MTPSLEEQISANKPLYFDPEQNPKSIYEERETRLKTKIAAKIELIKRAAKKKDILLWGKLLFPEKFYQQFCRELHEYMISIRTEEFTSTEAPRGHSKTTIKCFLIPIFQALEEPTQFCHYLNIQATEDKALAVNRSIKMELEQNRYLKLIYGEMIGERWTDQQFVLKNGVVFSCLGAGQSIRGVNYRQFRPDYVIVDDLYDERHIENPEATESINGWFWGSLYKALAIGRRTSLHLQGTAINNYDLLHQMKKDPRAICRTFRAIKDFDRKIVLWPESTSYEKLMLDLVRMGSIRFYRELQNDRLDDTTSKIKRSWLYRKDGTSWECDMNELWEKIRKKEMYIARVTLGNDPSIGKTAKSDKNGIALIYEAKCKDSQGGSEYYIDSLDQDLLSLQGRITRIQEMYERINKEFLPLMIAEVRIEAISAFDDYASEVIRLTNLPVRKIEQVKDKQTILTNKSTLFENRKVFLNKDISQELKDDIVFQLTTNEPKHDDLRDAVFLALDNESLIWNFI